MLHSQRLKQGTEGLEISVTQVLRIADASHTVSEQGKKSRSTTKGDGFALARADLHDMILKILILCGVTGEAQKRQDLNRVRLDE